MFDLRNSIGNKATSCSMREESFIVIVTQYKSMPSYYHLYHMDISNAENTAKHGAVAIYHKKGMVFKFPLNSPI